MRSEIDKLSEKIVEIKNKYHGIYGSISEEEIESIKLEMVRFALDCGHDSLLFEEVLNFAKKHNKESDVKGEFVTYNTRKNFLEI